MGRGLFIVAGMRHVHLVREWFRFRCREFVSLDISAGYTGRGIRYLWRVLFSGI